MACLVVYRDQPDIPAPGCPGTGHRLSRFPHNQSNFYHLERRCQSNPQTAAPQTVAPWTDKKEYLAGEKIKVYLKGNKPFYARLLYRDAAGATIQLLSNPHRGAHGFNGGVIYEVPGSGDRFELEVAPPPGEENLIVYASTAPLGEIGLAPQGGVYQVTTKPREIGTLPGASS